MSNKLKLVLTAFTLFLVVGCSSNPASLDRKALSANKVSVIDLTSSNTVTHEPSTRAASAGGIGGFVGGAIGAGVDIAINARRVKTLAPVISALGTYNAQTVLANKLKSIRGNSVANNVTVNVSNGAISSATNALNVTAVYTLLPNHQAVSVKATTKLKANEKAAIYKRNFAATSNINFDLKDGEKLNATSFLQKNPQKLKQAIESAMDSVVSQISNDINVGAAPTAN